MRIHCLQLVLGDSFRLRNDLANECSTSVKSEMDLGCSQVLQKVIKLASEVILKIAAFQEGQYLTVHFINMQGFS